MLDKSLPYKNIIMEISAEKILSIKEPTLPKGYSFCFFSDGMEKDWAKIETSVLEFECEEEAESYFCRDYLPFSEQLYKRCVFIKNPDNVAIATATAWFSNSEEYPYQPSLHWVGVHPDYQGLGLGKAISQFTTKLFGKTDGGKNAILHTQTWSHKAVVMYLNIGYTMCREKRFALCTNGGKDMQLMNNDYAEAVAILKNIFPQSIYDKLIKTSI